MFTADARSNANWSRSACQAKRVRDKDMPSRSPIHSMQKLDEAREDVEALGEASKPTLFSSAKERYRPELVRGDLARATAPDATTLEFHSFSRSVYANRPFLLVAGKVNDEKAEALIGYVRCR